MIKRIALLCLAALLALAGCQISLAGNLPTPTTISLPSLTPALESPTPISPSPTPFVATETLALPSPTVGATSTAGATASAAVTPGATVAGAPSGPYAVVRVLPGDTLNIRSAAGVGNSVVGSFPATAANVMRSGPSTVIDGQIWVQVQNPTGGTGWVSAAYLSETVTPATFCADGRVNDLLTNFGNALRTSNGDLLASLVSPAHGLDVRTWRQSTPINFMPEFARWVFESTYEHNWGMDPASGYATVGSFEEVILPNLLDVYEASYTLSCNTVQVGGASYDASWPAEYTHLNYYSLYKPGTPGTELDWRTWLVGIEYVSGQPYLFSLIHFQWEP
ncbi:MAG: SH3 domain-containing protein [Anaerolineales bacterium]|nr:SH3 domain-containing protein [Anaerolineales bacterium]